MTVEEAIVAKLTAANSVTKPIVAQRIYPAYVPDTAVLPCIMYERKPDQNQSQENIDGTVDHVRAVYKINCYAAQEAFAAAQATADAVTIDLRNYRAALTGLTIHNIWHNKTYTDYDGTNKRQRVTVEVEIWYT